MSSAELESAVRRLSDRVEIEALMARYCRHADQLDADGMAACFTEDCVSYAPQPGKVALLAFLRAWLPGTRSSTHYVSNFELSFEDADAASVHCYMHSWTRRERYPAIADALRYGRYELRAVRTTQGWRFSHIRLITAGGYGGVPIGEQFGRPWPPHWE